MWRPETHRAREKIVLLAKAKPPEQAKIYTHEFRLQRII